jgi:hypothetical protein
MKLLYSIIAFCLLISYTTFSQSISSNAPLCGNANLTLELTATGGSTYAWKGPNSFTSTQQKPSIKNANYRNRGVYTVMIDNKTTLTTDVNIKDPVAFTVPKEISVCEGGSLVIPVINSKLTDSTEIPEFYIYRNSLGESISFPTTNFSSRNTGEYQVTGDVYSWSGNNANACPSTQKVNVKINTSPNCKSIQIEDLTKIKICYGQEVNIPFTTKNIPQGTKFKVYVASLSNTSSYDLNKPLAIIDKSPIKLNIDNYHYQNIAIVVIADDAEKTKFVSNYRNFYTDYQYRDNNVQSTQSCESSNLSMRYTNNINFIQWYLDGNSIDGATKKDFIAKKSGTYTFRFQGNNTNYNIDQTCLYESPSIKIELGKIEKPYAYVSDDIELCVGKPAILDVIKKSNTNYRWKKNGTFINNANQASFETLQEGKYQVEAKEGTCTAVSDTMVLKNPERLENLYIKPINSIRGGEINNTYQLCNNQSFDISLESLSPNTRLQIIKNGRVSKDTISNFIKGIKESGEYFIKASYGTCSGVSNIMNIKYDKYIYITSGDKYYNVRNICEGQTTGISFNSERLYNNDIRQVKYSLEKGKIYRNGEQIEDWNANFGYYSSYFSTNQSGSYYGIGSIKLADGSICGLYSDTIKVNFSKKIQDKPYQYDDNLQLIPIASCKDTVLIDTYYYYGSGQYGREIAYKWTKDGVILKQDSSRVLQATQSGTYHLETNYKGGCVVTSSPYKVDFGKIGLNWNTYLTPLICENQAYNLYSGITEISDKNTYNFTKDGKTISTQLQSPYILTQSGTYKLKVTNGKCEGTSPDFTLKVDKIPTTITPSDSLTFCDGKTVEFKTSTEAGLSYIWERNGSVISQANQANYTANADGLYKATLLRGACWGTTPSVKLKTLANIIPTATLTGDKKIAPDEETKLSINLTSHAPWTFKLSDGKEYTATKSPFEVSVKPLSTTTYSLSEVKNICGTGTVSGSAKIEIIILSSEEEKELNVEVFPVPSSEICHWKIETPQATNASVMLYDVLGVTQYSQNSPTRTQAHEGTIDLTNMKAGTYFLKLQAGEKSVVRKVMKY